MGFNLLILKTFATFVFRNVFKTNYLLMKKYFALLTFVVLCGYFSAQAQNSGSWQLYANQGDVSIFYKYDDCKIPSQGFNQSWVYIKIENKSKEKKNITWQYELFYDGLCRTCGKDEYKVSFDLNPGEIKEGTCALGRSEMLNIFVKHLDIRNVEVLTDFKLSNIIVH
jgi:hypothetical protein